MIVNFFFFFFFLREISQNAWRLGVDNRDVIFIKMYYKNDLSTNVY